MHTSLSLIPNCVGVWYMLLSCEFMHLWQRACVFGMSQVNHPSARRQGNLIQRVFRDFFVCSGLQLVDVPHCLPKGPYLVDFTKHGNEMTLG